MESKPMSDELIDRDDDYALYHYKHSTDETARDDEFISKIAWVIPVSFSRVHLYKALGFDATKFHPLMKRFVYK
ncbi:unnamed protein product [Adineta ricciae]|uniref:Uncharacterized protein n=1 Tax=Adineta ricciae TaxID=249248 RepID=A0A816HCD7_ADIRI|nr:unnamed protein product [Adineta ricciae]